MKTLYTAFKGKNNTSYQLVSRIDNNSLFLTNSFTGLEKDITRFDCDFDAVYMFGIDKNLVDKIRIDLCACYNSEHTLSTASGKTLSDTPSATSKFSVTGGKLTESGKLGTIEVIISKSDVQGITTEAALKAAIANGGTIEIGSNIILTNAITITKAVEIDLCGYTIEETNESIQVSPNGGNLTVKNGTLVSNESMYLIDCYAPLTVVNCTLKGNDYENRYALINVNTKGSLIIDNCTFENTSINKNVKDIVSYESVTLSGNVTEDKGIKLESSGSMTVLAGTYNFDPTQYVDANTYIINNNGTTWTVTKK